MYINAQCKCLIEESIHVYYIRVYIKQVNLVPPELPCHGQDNRWFIKFE